MPWGGICPLPDHPHHWHEIPQYFVIVGEIISLGGGNSPGYKRNFAIARFVIAILYDLLYYMTSYPSLVIPLAVSASVSKLQPCEICMTSIWPLKVTPGQRQRRQMKLMSFGRGPDPTPYVDFGLDPTRYVDFGTCRAGPGPDTLCRLWPGPDTLCRLWDLPGRARTRHPIYGGRGRGPRGPVANTAVDSTRPHLKGTIQL